MYIMLLLIAFADFIFPLKKNIRKYLKILDKYIEIYLRINKELKRK